MPVILASFTDWAGLAIALCALLVAMGGFYYAGRQLSNAGRQLSNAGLQLLHAQRTAEGTFLLDLEEVFRQHGEVHKNLDSPTGRKWAPSDEEWPAIEAYMGVFERIQLLMEREILDIETIDRLYSYRVINIVLNDQIHRQRLVEKEEFWPDFFKLWRSLQGQKYWEANLEYLGEAATSRARPAPD